jgi:hypothetical protein
MREAIRIAAAPAFPGQRRFPEGRGFRQWTGDDSKALMKVCTFSLFSWPIIILLQVYIPAITGHVPRQMVQCFAAFLEFCYLVRRNTISETTLNRISNALDRFHVERVIFLESGVRIDFNLPRQHSLNHYRRNIEFFGAPNGLCSSITESKHIKAVKEPWRRSSRFEALGQMLVTNQRLDKLSASRVDFISRGLLPNARRINPSVELPIFGDPDAVEVPGPRVMNIVTLAQKRG